MKFINAIVWCVLYCLVSVGASHLPNFIAKDDLSDGEHEIRIHYDGVSAKQTSVGHDQGSDSGLVLRQVSHHRHLLTMIYVGEVTDMISVDGLSLRDCDLTNEPHDVERFMDSFRSDVELTRDTPQGSWAGPLHNVSFVHLSDEAELPQYLRPVTHFKGLRAQCKDHQRRVRHGIKADRRARKHNKQQVAETETQPEAEVTQPETVSRRKRWILNELLILPGTNWCGNDDRASSYHDLSGYVGADTCCRSHDLCPINIGGLTQKYGIYNSRFTTISHCVCDERFRACLRKSKTGAANMVGKVFFDVIRTRCFVFKTQKVCKKKSWWGRCEKYGVEKVAVVRDPIPWTRTT